MMEWKKAWDALQGAHAQQFFVLQAKRRLKEQEDAQEVLRQERESIRATQDQGAALNSTTSPEELHLLRQELQVLRRDIADADALSDALAALRAARYWEALKELRRQHAKELRELFDRRPHV